MVATWDVRTMAERAFNSTGHAEDLLLVALKYTCDLSYSKKPIGLNGQHFMHRQ